MKYLLYFLFLFVFIIGLSEIVHSFRLTLFRPKRTNKIVLFNLYEKTAELDLAFIIEEISWIGRRSYADKIIALNYLTTVESYEKCNRLAAKYSIEIVNPNELYNKFSYLEF